MKSPNIKAETTPAKRVRGCYEIDGKQLPSVTTVIGEVLAKPALMYWYGKHGTSECNRIGAESRSFGSAMHKIVSSYLETGTEPDTGKMATNILRAWTAWFEYWTKNSEQFLEVEKVIHNDEYAGTADLVGEDLVMDWKFSGGIYDANKIQLGAYARLTEATRGKIVRVSKDEFNIEVLEMTEDELTEAARIFDHLLEVFWWGRGGRK